MDLPPSPPSPPVQRTSPVVRQRSPEVDDPPEVPRVPSCQNCLHARSGPVPCLLPFPNSPRCRRCLTMKMKCSSTLTTSQMRNQKRGRQTSQRRSARTARTERSSSPQAIEDRVSRLEEEIAELRGTGRRSSERSSEVRRLKKRLAKAEAYIATLETSLNMMWDEEDFGMN